MFLSEAVSKKKFIVVPPSDEDLPAPENFDLFGENLTHFRTLIKLAFSLKNFNISS